MKSTYISFVFLVASLFINAQMVQFQRTWGGLGQDFGFAVITPDSGYAILGSMEWTNLNASHATLIRTDKYGDTLWTRNFYYTNTPVNANSISLTHDSCLFVAIDSSYYGRTYKINLAGNILWVKDNLAPFEPFVKTYDGGYIISGGNGIAKFDSLLNVQFVMYYGPSLDHGGFRSRAIQTTDSGFAMVGYTRMLASGGPNDRDIYIVKTDKNGNLQWDKSLGHASGFDYPTDIIQTFDKGLLISGHSFGIGAGDWDMILIKVDSLGNQQWCKTYGDVGEDFSAFIRKVTGSTDYYLVGSSPRMESNIFNGQKTVLIRVSMNGNYVQGRMFRDPNTPSLPEMAINTCIPTEDGGVVLCGFRNAPQDIWMIKADNQCSSGCNEINVVPTIFTHTLTTNSSGLQLSSTFQTGQGRQHQMDYYAPTENIICSNHIITSTNETPSTTNELLIYPNPATTQVTLQPQQPFKNAAVTIYNTLGAMAMQHQNIKGEKITIATDELPAGIYFITVLDEDKTYTSKLIIE